MRATETILVFMTALFLTAELSASERIQVRLYLAANHQNLMYSTDILVLAEKI